MAEMQLDINRHLERIGFGKFQVVAMMILWLRYFSYSSTTSLVAILEPYLRCHWNLSYITAAWIVLPEAIMKIAGSVVLGKLSDRYGRRKMMILAFFFNAYLTLLFSLSSSVLLLSVIRGAIGLVSSSTMISFTYAMEILPMSKRKYMSFFAAAFFAGCGYGIIVAMESLRYLTWRWFDAFSETTPITMAAFAVIFLPESPRYLVTVGKSEEAKRTLQRIAKMNGVPDYAFPSVPDYNSVKIATERQEENEASSQQQQSKYEIVKRIAIVSLLQFFGDIVSATMRFGSMQFGENSDEPTSCGRCYDNLTYKYRWAVESAGLFAVATTYLLIGKITRRLTMKILVICIAVCLVPFYWPLRGWPLLLAINFSELAASTLNNVILVYRAELFVTSMRTSGCGISDAAGQLGILLGQFIAVYSYHLNNTLSIGILHGLTALSIVVIFTSLEETSHRHLK